MFRNAFKTKKLTHEELMDIRDYVMSSDFNLTVFRSRIFNLKPCRDNKIMIAEFLQQRILFMFKDALNNLDGSDFPEPDDSTLLRFKKAVVCSYKCSHLKNQVLAIAKYALKLNGGMSDQIMDLIRHLEDEGFDFSIRSAMKG